MQMEDTNRKPNRNQIGQNKLMTNIIEAFQNSNGVNAPIVARIVGYANDKSKLETLKKAIKSELDSILSDLPAKQQKAAIKQLRASLVEGGIDKRKVSVILLDLGIRERAASEKKDELADELAAAIEALIALANEAAGEHATIALRRAYLTSQGKQG
jgi:capsid protein